MKEKENKIFPKITASILLCTILTYTTAPVFAYTKEETVYSKLNTDGENYETLVSNHLVNDAKEDLINDISDLLNIKNVNGDETFTQKGNQIIWDSDGNDIYYQGESKKALPIDMTVKYELDGEEISAEDLARKKWKC